MESKPKKACRSSRSFSGASGEYFVAGELSRLGYISLPTVKNTKGVDIIVSTPDFKKSAFLQIKTNKNKYDFWIVGKPVVGANVFYVFVNLLSNEEFKSPEFYIVPSKDIYEEFRKIENAKNVVNLTNSQKQEVIDQINARKTAWAIVSDLEVSVRAIRKIANENGLHIQYDRGKGEDFPFCFYIRKERETKYRDKWELIFSE